MKYKCKDCGKIYENKPDYCECGNDSFLTMRTKAERDAIMAKPKREEVREEKKENPIVLVLFLVAVGFLAYFVMNKVSSYKVDTSKNDEYLTEIRQEMLEDFDPQGITRSGYCIISFKINKEGKVYDKKFLQKSKVKPLNEKVIYMFDYAKAFQNPPLAFTDTPIDIEIGCTASETEVSCYTKNMVK